MATTTRSTRARKGIPLSFIEGNTQRPRRYHAYTEHHPGAPDVEYAVVITQGKGGEELGYYAVESLPLALRIARAVKRGRIGVARELLASDG